MEKTFRLGYMPTRRTFFSADDAGKYKELTLKKIREIVPGDVKIFDLDWLNEEGLLYDDQDAKKAADYYIKNEIDALFSPHCNFGTENAVAQVSKKVGKPLLVWAPRDEAPLPTGERLRDSQCGSFATSKVLQRYGVPFSYIINSRVNDNVFCKGFQNFIKASNVVKFSRNIRIGQIASRPQSFYSIIVNENELIERFGIEIIPFNLDTVIRLVNDALASKKKEVKEVVNYISAKADFLRIAPEATDRIAALKLVLNNLIRDNNLQSLAFQCWDELQHQLGICSCFVHAVITEEGTPVSCESDIHGAISSLMLQAAGMFSEPTFFSDLTIRHPENDNAELLWHCGAFPPSLSTDREKSFIGEHFVLPSHAPGTCNWQLKKGDITVIRFDGINGKYSLFCGQGKAIDGPFNLGTYVYLEVNDWPLWEEKIIYGPYVHHTSCMYGHHAPVLYEATRYMNGVMFDPAEPDVEEIRKFLRSN